jgi:hypothetical protein
MDRLRPRQPQRHTLRMHPSIMVTPWCRYATWPFHRASGGDRRVLEATLALLARAHSGCHAQTAQASPIRSTM